MSDNALSQSHSGSGDNVANNKVVFETHVSVINKIVPENLQTPIKDILKQITNREFIKARGGIKFIEGMDNLSEDIKELLQLLVVKCDISEKQDGADDLALLNSIFSTSKNPMIKDLSLSLIFRSEVLKFGVEHSLKRYNKTPPLGLFSRAAAFQLFFEKRKLIDVLESEMSSLTEEEKLGLINGLFREECYEEALEAAEDLHSCYDNYNSKVVLLFAKSYKLDVSLTGTDYFTLKQNKKNEVLNLINEAISLFKESEDIDIRFFNIFVPSLIYVKVTHKELENICLENIEQVSAISQDFCDDLKFKSGRDDLSSEHPINIISKTKKDKGFEKETINKITQKGKVSYNELRMAREIMPFAEFKDWVGKGVNIEGDFTSVGEKLNKIFIAISIKDKDSINTELTEVAQENNVEFQKATSEFITMLTDSMQAMGLIYDSCSLMLKFIGELDDVWCSPLIEDLIYSLYRAARYKDLIWLSEKVNDQDKTFDFDNIVIYTQLYFDSPEKAFTLIENYKHENNIEYLRLRLLTFIKLGRQDLIMQDVENYDYSLFTPPSPVIGNFVALLVSCNQMAAYEKIVVDWFIDSPEKNYRYISDACLSLMLNESKVDFNPSYDIQGLSRGVQYNDGNKTLTRLISSSKNFSNPYILNPDTVLSSGLISAKSGDELETGFKNIKVEDVLTPYIAITRLSLKIRDEFNDGSDAFQVFTASNDPKEIIAKLKKALSYRQSNKEGLQSVLSNDTAPLSFRMFLIEKANHVRAALSLLLNKSSHMKGFIDSGEENCESFCTDLVTIIYSCLTSFSKFFVEKGTKLYMMQEEIDDITSWIKRIDADKFLALNESVSGEMFFSTSKSVKKNLGYFLNNLKEISYILYPLNIIPDNYNQEVTELAESFGQNYPKQVYAFKNSGLAYLSIDSQNCFLIKSLVPINLANTSKIFHKARDFVTFPEREEGLTLHIYGAIPYPLMIDDIFNLSISENDKDGLKLTSLIRKYTGGYNKNIKLHQVMAQVVAHYCDKSLNHCDSNKLLYTNNPFGPSIDRVFNAAARAVISSNEKESCETKFAKLIVPMVFYSRYINGFTEIINNLSYDFCVGHFLDIPVVRLQVQKVFLGKLYL